MAFNLRAVVPWGRSFDEYRAMFSLSQGDLRRSILGCGDGPAGFNAVLARRGGRVVSVDPLYALAVEAIRLRIDAAFPEVLEQARSHSDEFVWRHVKSVEELGRLRRAAMEEFLGDYQKGKRQGRYGRCQGFPG